jgi:hypothetical protein
VNFHQICCGWRVAKLHTIQYVISVLYFLHMNAFWGKNIFVLYSDMKMGSKMIPPFLVLLKNSVTRKYTGLQLVSQSLTGKHVKGVPEE